ncbi:MAG TPA: hypothetical protein VGM03_05470 [Phycisphaerae bacterium]
MLAGVADDDRDESHFIDRVNRGLRRGDVLALIVGDGIQTALQELVAHLCRDTPHLRYSLALVELGCYQLQDSPHTLFIVPRVVQEVEPVERAYVRIDLAPGLEGKLTVTPVAAEPLAGPRTGHRLTLDEEELIAALDRIEPGLGLTTKAFYDGLVSAYGLELEPEAPAVMIKIPHPHDEQSGASVLGIERSGRVYNPDHLRKQLGRWRLPETVWLDYWKELHSIDAGFSLEGISHIRPKQFIPLQRVREKFPAINAAVGRLVAAARAAAQEHRAIQTGGCSNSLSQRLGMAETIRR